MKKRQIATIGIMVMLIWGVFFLTKIINSDDDIELSFLVPVIMSVPILVVGALLIYFSRE